MADHYDAHGMVVSCGDINAEITRLREEHLAVMGATADLYASVNHYLTWAPKPTSAADRVLIEKIRERLLAIGFGKEGVRAPRALTKAAGDGTR